MSPGPRVTVDDRPSDTPDEGRSTVVGSTMGPAVRDPAESPLAPSRPDDHVAQVAVPLRGVALVMAAGLVGFAGWMVWMAWRGFIEGWTGRVPMDGSMIGAFLLALPFLLVPARRLWLVARRGGDPEPEAEVVGAVESRAFLEAVERHDRLLAERQAVGGAEGGGESDLTSGDPG